VEQLQPLNPAYTDYTHHLGAVLGVPPDGMTVLASVYQQALEQATLLSYLDGFKILGVIFLALIPLLLLVKPGKGGVASAAAAH
jgi:DHA2 family multidrug resistance protein